MSRIGFVDPLGWEELGRAQGVVLRAAGEGPPVVVFPGMEGSGESCLHLAVPVVLPPSEPALGRLILVDYANERHRFLGQLVDTITRLLDAHLDGRPVTWWGQSFGNLLLARVAPLIQTPTRRFLMVSPFTGLPSGRVRLAHAALALSSRSLYSAMTPPIARWVFGPAPGSTGDTFVDALARMNPADVRRRVDWLVEGDLAGTFFTAGPLPVVWFGERDRLVDLPRQLAFFAALTRCGGQANVIPGCGHVALPPAAVMVLCSQLREELTR